MLLKHRRKHFRHSYAVQNEAWVNTGATLPGNLGYSQLAIIGDYVYLFGGLTGSSSLTSTNVIYRAPLSNPTSWSNTGSILPNNLWTSQLAIIGDYVYLFGGFHGSGSATNVIYRAPLSNPTSWSNTGAALPDGLGFSQLAIIGNYVYLFCGTINTSGSATNVIYRAPLSNPTSWSNTGTTTPERLGGPPITIIGNHVYAYWSLSNVIYRAPLSNPLSWSNTGSTLPNSLSASQLAIIGDHVYLFGGYSSNVIYRAPLSDPTSWSNTGATLPSNLSHSNLAIIGDYVYLFGGGSSNVIYRTPINQISGGDTYSNINKNKFWKIRENNII